MANIRIYQGLSDKISDSKVIENPALSDRISEQLPGQVSYIVK